MLPLEFVIETRGRSGELSPEAYLDIWVRENRVLLRHTDMPKPLDKHKLQFSRVSPSTPPLPRNVQLTITGIIHEQFGDVVDPPAVVLGFVGRLRE